MIMETEESVLLIEENPVYATFERKPDSEFAESIEMFWSAPRHGGSRQRIFEILPDGNFDMVFLLDDSCCTLQFAGPYTQRAYVPVSNSCEYFGIRFRPGRMPRIADIKPVELVDTMVDLPKMLGIDVNTLGEYLYELKDIDSRQKFIENAIRRVGVESVIPKDLCNRSARVVESFGGCIKVRELANLMGVSIRTLERVFLEQAGISPKKFIRCVRFQNVLARLRGGVYLSLTELAYDCGYADQSHFIKDFKRLSGKLPGCAAPSHLSRFYNL